MTTMRYRISCTVPEHKLGTVIDVLSKEAQDMRVEPVESPHPTVVRRRKRSSGAKPISETEAGKALLANLPPHFTNQDAMKVLENAGFKASSASSTLTSLVREGFIQREPGRGQYVFIRTLVREALR